MHHVNQTFEERLTNDDGYQCALDSSGFPRVGVMEFDVDDVNYMISTNTLNSVILHEMGHVLGFGTLWDQFQLSDTTTPPGIYYKGTEGNRGNVDIGRTGRAVIEDIGGPGTAGGHWKEDLPTGYDT